MRQVVHAGRSIEVATPEEVANIIAASFSRRDSQEYTRLRGAVQLDVNGAGTDTNDVPAQYDWVIERVAFQFSTNIVATVMLWENEPSVGTNLLAVMQSNALGLYSDGFSNRIHVPANSKIVVQALAGGANGGLGYNLQVQMQPRPQGSRVSNAQG